MTTISMAATSTFHEYDTFGVVFAENPDGSGFRLEFQLADSFDEQDRELGMDTYCTVTSDGATHYGGVSDWAISDLGLDIHLEADAAECLGLPSAVRLKVSLTGDKLAELRDAITRILGKTR